MQTSSYPLVTIGMPVFNGERHVGDALRSALRQDYAPLEIVVSDNASTDRTADIVQSVHDPRVRYVRNARNIGPVANLRRVLGEARGGYFTWLAHDDLLTDPTYLSRCVAYLERHPDAVACTTGLYALDYEGPGSLAPMPLTELAPERPWPEARADLFRWPPTRAQLAVYGVMRRDVLRATLPPARRYRGRPTAAWWEMLLVTRLATRGRLVALPECARAYRISPHSEGQRIYRAASPLDLLRLSLGVRLAVVKTALRVPPPWSERGALLRLTLGNLTRANLRHATDYRHLCRERARERDLLLAVAEERDRAIAALRAAVDERLASLRQHGRAVETAAPADLPQPTLEAVVPPERPWRPRDLVRRVDPALPLAAWALNQDIGRLRQHVDAQMAVMQQLEAEARALMVLMRTDAER